MDVDRVCCGSRRLFVGDAAVVDGAVVERIHLDVSEAVDQPLFREFNVMPQEDGEVPVLRRPHVLLKEHPPAQDGEAVDLLSREVPPRHIAPSFFWEAGHRPRISRAAQSEGEGERGERAEEDDGTVPLLGRVQAPRKAHSSSCEEGR